MDENDENSAEDQMKDLEGIHWIDEERSMRGIAKKNGKRMEREYQSYGELYDAIIEYGPLVVASSKVDVMFFAVSGEFDGHLVAVRQSGRNVRRFLVRKVSDVSAYGSK